MPLSVTVQVRGFGVDVDGFGNAPPKPVTLFVQNRDLGLVNIVIIIVDVVSDWRGGALMLVGSYTKPSFCFTNVGGSTVITLYFIYNPCLVQLVHLVFGVDKALPDGVCGLEVDLDPCLANVPGDRFCGRTHVRESNATLGVVAEGVRWTESQGVAGVVRLGGYFPGVSSVTRHRQNLFEMLQLLQFGLFR